jgi:PDZ domain
MSAKMRRICSVLGLIVLTLVGCASPAERPNARAGVSTDEFSKTIDINGPLMVSNPFFGLKSFYKLVTHVDKQTHRYEHVIETQFAYNGNFIYFQLAADDTAQALQFIPIRRERNTAYGDRMELFNVVVPDASLRAHAATGYRVKISARTGEEIILTINAAMIATQFQTLDTVLAPASRATSAAVPATSPAPGSTSSSAAPTKPFLGIAPMDLWFGAGVMVSRVDPGTPAEAAGFEVGDLVRSYDGHPIKKADDVRDFIAQTVPGSKVSIEVDRHGAHLTLLAQM